MLSSFKKFATTTGLLSALMLTQACTTIDLMKSQEDTRAMNHAVDCMKEAIKRTGRARVENFQTEIPEKRLISYAITGAPEEFQASLSLEIRRDGKVSYRNLSDRPMRELGEFKKLYVQNAIGKVDQAISESCSFATKAKTDGTIEVESI